MLGNVMEGVGATKALLDRFDEVSAKLRRGIADDEMDTLIAEQAELQEKIDAADAWDLDRTVEIAMDALRCPPGDADGRARSPAASAGAWRSAGCCCRSPTCCCSTSRPTISTPNRWPGWSASCSEYPGTVVAVTHDRYFLDNVAGWILELDRGHGIPWEGNYSSWLEQKQKRLAQRGEDRRRAPAHPGARAGVDPAVARGAPGQEQGAHHRLRGAAGRGAASRAPETGADRHPARAAARRSGDRGRDDLRKGFGDRLLIDDLDLQPAARRHRRRDRPQRRRQDHAVPHDHRPGEARRRHACASARR